MQGLIVLILFFSFAMPVWGKDAFVPTTFILKNWGNDTLLQTGSPYKTIVDELGSNYQTIGQGQISRLNKGKDGKPVVGLNHIGINLRKNFATFYANFKREVVPDLYDENRHIVVDTLDIFINADDLLSRLHQEEIIKISDIQLNAYGGIIFKRTYRYIHFADSYLKGLRSNLNKLFFSFQLFRRPSAYLKMKPYEYISKEDSMTIKGVASISPSIRAGIIGVGLGIGGAAEFHSVSKLEVQAVGPDDKGNKDEKFRISFEKERGKSLAGFGSLQVDFLKVLNYTLFKYEFVYDYFTSKKVSLSFSRSDLDKLSDGGHSLGRATRRFLFNGKSDMGIFSPYLVSSERRKEVSKKSRYNILHKGRLKECKTSQVQVVQGNKIKNFFRHNYNSIVERVQVSANLLAKIIRAIFDIDSVDKNSTYENKSVCIEYESEENLIDSKGDLFIGDGEKSKLSLNFKQTYYAATVNEERKEVCSEILQNCPGVEPEVVDSIESGEIASDVKINTSYIMNRNAINHFNHLSIDQVYDAIDILCTKENICTASDNLSRPSGRCRRELQNSYDRYFQELRETDYTVKTYYYCKNITNNYLEQERHRSLASEDCSQKLTYSERYEKCKAMVKRQNAPKKQWMSLMKKCMDKKPANCQKEKTVLADRGTWMALMESCIKESNAKKEIDLMQCSIPLWNFKEFINKMYKYSNKKEDFYAFFGEENIFFKGQLVGSTEDGERFKSCFQDGTFAGQGIIDSYLYDEKIRSSPSMGVE